MDLLQLLLNAISLGCIFALVGVGIQLVYAALGVLNFAHGAFAMLGGFLAVAAVQGLGLPLGLALVFTMAGMALVGLVFSLGVYAPLKRRPHDALIIGMLAAATIIDNFSLLTWGPTPYRLTGFFAGRMVNVGSTTIFVHNLAVILVTAVVIVCLYLFLERTLAGKILRAVAQDREVARMLGIRAGRMTLFTFSLAAALAGLAGVLMVPSLALTLSLGTNILIKGFAAAVIGGVGNLRGVIFGGLIVGFLDVFAAFYISSEYVDSIVFAMVILVLFLKPQGLCGEAVQEKI